MSGGRSRERAAPVVPAVLGALMMLALLAPHAAEAQAEPVIRALDDRLGGGYAFEPARLAVAPGATVRLVAEGAEPHTVTPVDAGAFGEVRVQPDGEASFTAPQAPGEYRYYCRFHAAPGTDPSRGMAGVLVVEAAAPSSTEDDGAPASPPPRDATSGVGAALALGAVLVAMRLRR